jgi:hypothetical protein
VWERFGFPGAPPVEWGQKKTKRNGARPIPKDPNR